ncbi:MAG: phosphohydrolase [Desulfofustis sp.]|jgi:DNA-directed RNA polymerase subunit RPC12/RpoP
MKCPGQDMQYWKDDAIYDADCPQCGKPVEFYKDDTTRSCSHCGHRFVNPRMDFGCAAYCSFAEQCIGTLPEEFVDSRDNLLKDKVAVEMKRHYKTDFKQIGYLSRVARHAEKIGKEEGANLAVVLCAAYLRDIEKNSGEAAAILQRLGAGKEMQSEVCSLIRSLESARQEASKEAVILGDAFAIAEIEAKNKEQPIDEDEFEAFLRSRIITTAGQNIARAHFDNLAVP